MSSENDKPVPAEGAAPAPEDGKKQKQKQQPKEGGKKKSKKGKGGVIIPKVPEPEYVKYRVELFEKFQKMRAEEKRDEVKIEVTLPDGAVKEAYTNKTTPMDIALGISKSLAKKLMVAWVEGESYTGYWDLMRPFEFGCKLKLCTFDTPEGKYAFWHSSAHLLGLAMELQYGGNLCIGPPIDEGGFYYDIEMGDRSISDEDFAALEQSVKKVISDKVPFERLSLEKEEALELFKHNPFKQEIIKNKVPDGERCFAYRSGPLIDLCRGPHVPNSDKIKAMCITKNSAAYWLGNADNASLQRVYGISFPDNKQLKQHMQWLEEAKKRDHRKIGKDQQLWFFDEISPGSCFFLPHGTRIYNRLISFIRAEYQKRGFEEVVTPNMFNIDLWKTSGHYQNYKENMFILEVEKSEFGLKPMNCPGHCVMFGCTNRSYRDLPIRWADFGVLHRNEFSGALTGLTRVRRFQQDDAHIFCRTSQIEDEIGGCLDFLKHVYGVFGYTFNLKLSTRPEKYLGDIQVWNDAEGALSRCLDKFGSAWELNPGDGAFYGPKIDIELTDALNRRHQCATIQLDFQLPIRFDLKYKTEEKDQFDRPVIVHRAILGSVERQIAVLTEHCGGKWPFWISPRQVKIVPVSPLFFDYARQVRDEIHAAGFYVDVDDGSNQLNKKIRNAQLEQYNYILVVGEKEQESHSVAIRTRDNQQHGTKSVSAIIEELKEMADTYQ